MVRPTNSIASVPTATSLPPTAEPSILNSPFPGCLRATSGQRPCPASTSKTVDKEDAITKSLRSVFVTVLLLVSAATVAQNLSAISSTAATAIPSTYYSPNRVMVCCRVRRGRDGSTGAHRCSSQSQQHVDRSARNHKEEFRSLPTGRERALGKPAEANARSARAHPGAHST